MKQSTSERPRSPRGLGLLLAAVALGLAAAGGWLWFASRSGESEPELRAPELDPGEQRAFAARMAERVDERPSGVQAERTAVAAPGVADGPGVRIRFVDARTREAVAGGRAVDFVGDVVSPAAGADGEVTLQGARAGRIAFIADGYLAKLPQAGDEDAVALAEAARSGGAAQVPLRRDDYTLPCTLRFTDAEGRPVAVPVRFSIACLDEPPPTAMSFPTARLGPGARVDEAIQRAWQQHVAVQMLPVGAPSRLHLGVQSHGRVYEAEAGTAEMRFVAAGRYTVTAVAAAAELAGERVIHVAVGASGPFDIRLVPGRFASGVAVDAGDGRPLPGVAVRLLDGGPAVAVECETDAEGKFRLGPVAAPRVEVHAASSRHLDLVSTVPVGEEVRLALTPRPVLRLRGVVRQQPNLAPIAGAEVLVRRAGEVDARCLTAEDGTFALETTLERPELVVRAPDHLTWVELIREESAHLVCDLLLADPEARVRAGLTAFVEGRVLGPAGAPAAGVAVQLLGDEAMIPEGLPNRVVCEGHVLPLRPLAVTDSEGRFALEWHQSGTFRLVAADGIATAADGLPVRVVLGERIRDLVLRTQR